MEDAPNGDNSVPIQRPSDASFGNFRMTQSGLFAIKRRPKGDDDEDEMYVRVSAPFDVVGRSRTPDGTGWGREVRFVDDDCVSRECCVPDRLLQSDARKVSSQLADLGFRVERGRAPDLADYLNATNPPDRITRVQKTGWHTLQGERCFVFPEATVGGPRGEQVILEIDNSPFASVGLLQDWMDGVPTLVQGHGRGVLLMSASLAAPLLKLVGQEGVRFNIHRQSSSGKSTLLAAAASVWGRGALDGFVRTWRTTANDLESIAAIHNDVVLALDELGMADGRDAAIGAYQLTGGRGKSRSRQDGSLRGAASWTTVVLSTGEVRLADKIEERGGRAMAGQSVRLIDVPADAGKGAGAFDGPGTFGSPKDLADAIKQLVRTHFGTAGPAFVRAIIDEGADDIAERMRRDIAAFATNVLPPQADGQVRRVADRFGLAAAAGELAIALNIVPWPPGHARWAAETCFHDWLAARGGAEPYEVRAAISQVRAFIEAHGDSRFEIKPGDSGRAVIDRAGYRRGLGPDQQWLLMPEAWKMIVRPFNPKDVARWLADRGMLLKANDGYQRVDRIDGRPRRYHILTTALFEDNFSGGDGE